MSKSALRPRTSCIFSLRHLCFVVGIYPHRQRHRAQLYFFSGHGSDKEKAHRPEGQRANSGGRFAPVIRWGGDCDGGHLGRRGGCWFGNVDQWPAIRMRPRRIGDAMPMHIRTHLFNREIASALSLKRGAVIGRDAVAPAVHRGGSQAQHARNSRRATKVFYCDHGRIVRSAYTKAQACEQPRENTYK